VIKLGKFSVLNAVNFLNPKIKRKKKILMIMLPWISVSDILSK